MKRLLNILLIAYTILSLTVVLLLKIGYSTYGNQLTDAIMFKIIICAVLCLFLLKFMLISNTKTKLQTILQATLIALILFMTYLLLVDLQLKMPYNNKL